MRELPVHRVVRPAGPYALALCIRHANDATRHVRDGVLTTSLRVDGRAEVATARQLGLHARRGTALVRICRAVDLERLHDVPTDAVAARLGRERGVGPWTVGVVCLEGLGRPERGLVGDLSLVKLMSDLRGRWVEGHETAELLAPYGDWGGLASVYLGLAYSRGLIPLPGTSRARRPSAFFRVAHGAS